ncbi:hypothetical protein FHX74_001424 [Friedmanniella endophytica]|uniref:Excalibur calcium-binding domain-containing protein n=1 Tax=Microlunatus kandeliicorticis TaxID=1759536 RepID=A0A7W3IRB1_9ACTN|nr:excalibur calcium-binding domain-containing protein [Microlunatus kandeliicorticis]MBA8793819.1 hypothetical protein [Microlunatus kandeliicorticis]
MPSRLRTSVLTLTALAVATVPVAVAPSQADAAGYRYKNCTALHKKYPHGVGKSGAKDRVRGKTKPVTTFKRSTKIYKAVVKANKRLDADKDGVACEKR